MTLFDGGTILPGESLVLGRCCWLAFDAGVLVCALWLLLREGPRWLDIIGRLGTLGILAIWAEVIYAWRYFNFHALPGYPVLALGSTLICVGVWLTPPRQKHDGGSGNPQTANNAKTVTGTGGT